MFSFKMKEETPTNENLSLKLHSALNQDPYSNCFWYRVLKLRSNTATRQTRGTADHVDRCWKVMVLYSGMKTRKPGWLSSTMSL